MHFNKKVKMKTNKELLKYLSQYVTSQRLHKINELVKVRTRHVTVALEDVYQSHNAGAVVRSCDGLGIQDVHCIMQRNSFNINKGIAKGASKWLDFFNYQQDGSESESATEHCVETLKKKGYKIVATSPHAVLPLSELPLDNKLAFFFGTEEEGLTQEAVDSADYVVKIPMYGFTESFNVSVSVALCLYDVMARLRNSDIKWQLSEKEQQDLVLDWVRASLEHSEALEKEFYKK